MDDVVFVGDWIKERVLGSGSFGVVVLWKHKRTEEKLAIKTCKWGDELTDKHKERWTKEVEMLFNCHNPNIVGTKELPQEFEAALAKANPSKLPILCMEYCSGGDLRQLLNRSESCCGLKETQVRLILEDVRNALQFLHNNKIAHRDLKPENIVMQPINHITGQNLGVQGQRNVLYKLIDLGYAKEIDSNSVCASFVGTLQYLAPEIFYCKTYSNSVDYWSFGLLAHEIITGYRPFLPNMSPVQWMPHVKKKNNEHICIYETFHGDIYYADEIFPENHSSKPLKKLLERWLKLALEWDPKLRGKDAPSKVTFNIPSEKNEPSSNIVIFTSLYDILNRKIIKIFSMPTLSDLAYLIDDSVTVLALKTLIHKDTKLPISEQILISKTMNYLELGNDEIVSKYWNSGNKTAIYLYNKLYIIKDNIEPVVPKAVQRSLEHPKQLYNYNNSQTLYRNGLYLVMTQMELYDLFVNGLVVRAESLKQESKQLLLKHNSVDKNIGKLLAKYEIVIIMIETGKQHIQMLKENGTGTNLIGGFEKIFNDADDLTEKINKLQSAWSQLTVRLQSAARRSNENLVTEFNSFVAKYNYQTIYATAQNVYTSYRKTEREFRIKEKQCSDIMKVCCDCLKIRNKILSEVRNQPFVLKLIDLSVEFPKIADVILTASDNTEKLHLDLETVSNDLTQCMWSTISLLSSDAENLADLPYSVVSFQKQEFNINGPMPIGKTVATGTIDNRDDKEISTLVQESLNLTKMQSRIVQKLNHETKLLKENPNNLSFLNEML